VKLYSTTGSKAFSGAGFRCLSVFVILLSVIALRCSTCDAESISTTDFFYDGASARSFALGGTGAALTDAPDSSYWNPAGLTLLTGKYYSATKSTRTLLEELDIDTQSLKAALPMSGGVLGVNVVYTSLGTTLITTVDPETERLKEDYTIDSSETGAAVSYGMRWREDISLGITAKYMSLDIGSNEATGFGFDLGALYDYSETIRFGLSLQNVGEASVGTDSLPFNVRAGASGRFMEGRLMVSAAYDSDYLGASILGIGAEYDVADGIALRVGSRDGNFSVGAGFRHEKFNIDYGFSNDGLFGDQHKLTIGYHMPLPERKPPREKVEPETQPPRPVLPVSTGKPVQEEPEPPVIPEPEEEPGKKKEPSVDTTKKRPPAPESEHEPEEKELDREPEITPAKKGPAEIPSLDELLEGAPEQPERSLSDWTDSGEDIYRMESDSGMGHRELTGVDELLSSNSRIPEQELPELPSGEDTFDMDSVDTGDGSGMPGIDELLTGPDRLQQEKDTGWSESGEDIFFLDR